MYFDRRLWAFTHGLRDRLFLVTLIGLVGTVAGIARLALLGWLIGLVLKGAAITEIATPIALTLAAMGARAVLEYARAMLAHATAAEVQARLRLRLYDQTMALGPQHFAGTRTGPAVQAMVDGVEQLHAFFGQYVPQLLIALLAPFVVFVFAVTLDPVVALILLAAALVTLLAPVALHGAERDRSMMRHQDQGRFSADLLDALQGLATLKSFGQSGAKAAELTTRSAELTRSTIALNMVSTATRGLTDGGIAIGTAAALAVGAMRVAGGEMALEALLMLLLAGIEMFRPQRDLRGMLHRGMLGQAAAVSVLELLEARPSITPPVPGASSLPPIEPSIAFESVSFAYPGRDRPVHRGLSFAVRPGERVGIVGMSGSGKSSIVRLLQRLYDPAEGVVRVGGDDVRSLPAERLRGAFAIVQQDTFLFHGTVEENLRLARPEASDEEIVAAARAANAHAFITALPEGYRTIVGERGLRLSGGQRQRIAIARALLREAPILILDEALSSVDAENEAAIQATLDRLMAGRTTLVIAHRLSSVIGCDRILVLADGRVVESGSHAELMSRGGAYRRLMAEQAREAVAPSEALPALAEPAPLGETAAAPEHAAASDPAVPAIGWPRVLATLTRRIRPWAGLLSCTFAFGVGRVVALIAVGVLSAFVVARAAAGEPIGGLILALAILAPAAGLLHWLESWLAHDMAYKLLHHMRIELFRKLDALAPGYLLRRRSGDLVAMATHDIETVEYFYAHTIAPAFVSAVVPPTVLVILLLQGWPIALALLPFLIYVAVVPFLARRRVDRLAAEARAALGELSAFVTDTLQGLPEVFANQAGAHRRRLLEALVARHRRLQKPILRDLTLQSVLIELATGLGGLAVVLSGATLVASGALAPQLLAVLTLLAMAAFLPISEIAEVSRQLADTFAATRRLEVVHGEPVRVLDGPGVAAGDRRGGLAVSASAVTFAYPGTTAPALRDVALDIAPGATVALVGRSGAGKSTLAHLLLRFFDPDKGAIRIGGHDLREWRLDDLRGRVALVAQDTYLFNGTLADNVRLARPDASATELDAALRRSALGEFVDGLPDGLATPVGERGVQLSGGQRQRVAIARAFLKDAPILVLDEATSHLDAESEALVHRALDELRRDRTTFVVAHRLSTVRAADLIVVLDQGRVAETGRHEELLRRGGLYARLVGRQAAASSTPAAAAGT